MSDEYMEFHCTILFSHTLESLLQLKSGGANHNHYNLGIFIVSFFQGGQSTSTLIIITSTAAANI